MNHELYLTNDCSRTTHSTNLYESFFDFYFRTSVTPSLLCRPLVDFTKAILLPAFSITRNFSAIAKQKPTDFLAPIPRFTHNRRYIAP